MQIPLRRLKIAWASFSFSLRVGFGMADLVVLVFLVAFALLVGLALVFGPNKLAAQWRSDALEKVASSMGFSYLRTADESYRTTFRRFSLMLLRGVPRLKNLMKGVWAGREVLLFDYYYLDEDGENYALSIASFPMKEGSVPDFVLRPEGFLEGLAERRDIDFDTHPEFSKRYLLLGRDAAGIRSLFQPSLLDALQSMPQEWCVESDGRWMIVCGPRRKVRADGEHVHTFLDETVRVFELFANR